MLQDQLYNIRFDEDRAFREAVEAVCTSQKAKFVLEKSFMRAAEAIFDGTSIDEYVDLPELDRTDRTFHDDWGSRIQGDANKNLTEVDNLRQYLGEAKLGTLTEGARQWLVKRWSDEKWMLDGRIARHKIESDNMRSHGRTDSPKYTKRIELIETEGARAARLSLLLGWLSAQR